MRLKMSMPLAKAEIMEATIAVTSIEDILNTMIAQRYRRWRDRYEQIAQNVRHSAHGNSDVGNVEESFSSCTSRILMALDLWMARDLIESGAMLIALPACSRRGTILKIGMVTFLPA
jgi:hypothetical protein